jgi:beta-phosphoglucomutase
MESEIVTDIRIRAVLFDFNGVIIDDERVHMELFQEILASEGIPLTEEDYWRDYLGMDDRGCFAGAWRAAKGQEIPDDRLDLFVAVKAAEYQKRLAAGLPLYPGVPELVRSLSARYPLGIVSGALRPEIEGTLGRSGLLADFPLIVSAEDTEKGKPDPEGYIIAFGRLKDLGFAGEPGHVLVIEDSFQGVEAARKAGMKTFAVSHTYPADMLKEADRVFGRIGEIRLEDVRKA